MSGTWSPRGPCIACDSYTQYASVSVSPVARPVGVTSVVRKEQMENKAKRSDITVYYSTAKDMNKSVTSTKDVEIG